MSIYDEEKDKILHSLHKIHNLMIGIKNLMQYYDGIHKDAMENITSVMKSIDEEYTTIFLGIKRLIEDDGFDTR